MLDSASENFLTAHASNIFNRLYLFYGTISQQGYILELNGKVFRQTEIIPANLTGHKFSDIIFWQAAASNAQIISDTIEQVNTVPMRDAILSFRQNSREKFPVEVSFCRIENSENIFVCGKQISPELKLEKDLRRRYEQLLFAVENAEVSLWLWDSAGNVFYSTPGLCHLLEIPENEAIDFASFLQAVHPNDRAFVADLLDTAQSEANDFEIEFRVKTRDGLEKWIILSCKTVVNQIDDSINMVGLIREITDRKNSDRQLQEILELEKKARDLAEEANRSKDFFIAFVSHELRSPLNAILGWVKILLAQTVDENTQRTALETIERSARAQAKLINDLVDSARVTSGKLKLEFRPVNLTEVLRNVVESQTPAAAVKQIEIALAVECGNPQTFGDTNRLQQIFSNLISNALKFTPENGTININLECVGKQLIVKIKDSGQGISPDALPNIFRQFAQADETTSRDTSGLGLGLSIVKILIEKHGGTVAAASEGIGRGATFTVVLPQTEELETTAPQTKQTREINFKPLNEMTIFVVEDDPDSNEILSLFLNQYGARTITAMSAKEAFEKYQSRANEPPNLIISDLGMPEEDGYSLLRRIRSLPKNVGGEVPAIALSAFSSNDNKREAVNCGFQKYHVKPFEPDLLIRQIIELINNSK